MYPVSKVPSSPQMLIFSMPFTCLAKLTMASPLNLLQSRHSALSPFILVSNCRERSVMAVLPRLIAWKCSWLGIYLTNSSSTHLFPSTSIKGYTDWGRLGSASFSTLIVLQLVWSWCIRPGWGLSGWSFPKLASLRLLCFREWTSEWDCSAWRGSLKIHPWCLHIPPLRMSW